MSKQEDFTIRATKDAKYEVHGIFPTPVYTRENLITEDEFPFLKEIIDGPTAQTDGSDMYGERSENTYVLNQPALINLRKKLVQCVNEYANQCVGLAGEFNITQSWLSVKKPKQRHIMHSHANSIISGVFWFGNEAEVEGLTFVKAQQANTWQMNPLINPNVANEFSFGEITLKAENHMVCLFPSWLAHKVADNKNSTNRYSIAFNAVPKFALGWDKELTEFDHTIITREDY